MTDKEAARKLRQVSQNYYKAMELARKAKDESERLAGLAAKWEQEFYSVVAKVAESLEG